MASQFYSDPPYKFARLECGSHPSVPRAAFESSGSCITVSVGLEPGIKMTGLITREEIAALAALFPVEAKK